MWGPKVGTYVCGDLRWGICMWGPKVGDICMWGPKVGYMYVGSKVGTYLCNSKVKIYLILQTSTTTNTKPNVYKYIGT